jgi:tetratricopeptide (TPR) repeat protein
VLARQEFAAVYSDPGALSSLRGAEAGQPFLWLESARVAAVESSEQALLFVERGLSYHPTDPGLLTAQIELLGGLGRYDDCLDRARWALAALPQQPVRPGFRMGAIRALLALGRVDQIEPKIIALGGERDVQPAMVADAWARLAMAYAAVGRGDDAQRCFDASLRLSPNGLAALAQESALHPELLAAARSLRDKAGQRHPGDPDLLLAIVIDEMEQGRFAQATENLEQLPSPLPTRLSADVQALRARLLILQGQIDEGLSVLYEQLDLRPLDAPALSVLQETWARLGVPSDQEMLQRMLRARRYVDLRDSRTLAQLDGLLDELERRLRAEIDAAVRQP